MALSLTLTPEEVLATGNQELIDRMNEQNKDLIFKAVEDDNLELTKKLLDSGIDINITKDDKTLLFIACNNSYEKDKTTDMVELLLTHKPDLEKGTGSCRISIRPILLHVCNNYASDNNAMKIIKLLIENGADINSQVSTINSLIQLLIKTREKGDKENIKYLLEHGANPNLELKSGYSANVVQGIFDWGITNKDLRKDLIMLLLKHGLIIKDQKLKDRHLQYKDLLEECQNLHDLKTAPLEPPIQTDIKINLFGIESTVKLVIN